MLVGPCQGKKVIKYREKSRSYSEYVKALNFQRFFFQCILSDFEFLVGITPQVMRGSFEFFG